jgi:hypothetical protein
MIQAQGLIAILVLSKLKNKETEKLDTITKFKEKEFRSRLWMGWFSIINNFII